MNVDGIGIPGHELPEIGKFNAYTVVCVKITSVECEVLFFQFPFGFQIAMEGQAHTGCGNGKEI